MHDRSPTKKAVNCIAAPSARTLWVQDRMNLVGTSESRSYFFGDNGRGEVHRFLMREGCLMSCAICRTLERECDVSQSEYLDALSAVYFRFSTDLAAGKNVDLESARCALEEHRSVCAWARRESSKLPFSSALGFPALAGAEARGRHFQLSAHLQG
jgi:hypothetical protein